MNEDQLKDAIWAEYGDKLESLGIEDIDLIQSNELPSEDELAEDSCWLECLGRIGKFMVWLGHCAVKVATVFVLVTGLPDAWSKFTNYLIPDTQEVVAYMDDRFQSGNVLSAPGSVEYQSFPGHYLLYDRTWLRDPELLNQDQTRLRQGDNIIRDDRKFMVLPSSGSPEYVVVNSSSYFDFTPDDTT